MKYSYAVIAIFCEKRVLDILLFSKSNGNSNN
jgi:hypothetical protein